MAKKKLNTKKWMKVLQFFAAYLVAAWTFLQFIDWVLNRYNISPYWVDILLWFFIGIIPSLIYYLYHKERINKKLLSTKEKIILPLNVLLLLMLLYFGFGTSELGATTKEIAYEDASGTLKSKVITKSEFRTKIPLFNFTPINKDSSNAWLERGIRNLLFWDIRQDKNVDAYRFYADNTTDKVKGTSFYSEFYIDGTYEQINNQYIITPTIRNSRNGQLILEQEFKGSDFLKILDSISVFIREQFKIDKDKRANYIDLELNEFMSPSIDAIKSLIEGDYNKAIDLDNTFAFAYLQKGSRDINFSKGKYEEQYTIDQAYKHRNKLPFDMQLQVLINKHIAYGHWKEAEELIKLQLEIEPDNQLYIERLYKVFAETKQLKAFLEHTKNRFEKEENQRNINWHGKALLVNGEYKTYIKYATAYAEKFPEIDHLFYFNLVPEILSGDIEAARKTLDKAFILHPDWDNFTRPLDPAIKYLEANPIKEIDLSPFVGEFRNHRNEQEYSFWLEKDRLLFSASNQEIGNMIPLSDNAIIQTFNNIGGGSTATQIKDEKNNTYVIKFDQFNAKDNWSYYAWKLDDTIKKAEELLLSGNLNAAQSAYKKAIEANPNHYYLKDALAHIEYIQSIDETELQKQFDDVAGTYSFNREEAKHLQRKLWIEEGKLMYLLEGSGRSRIELLPISKNKYINLTNLDQQYEFEYKNGDVVGCFNWFFNIDTMSWETVDTNYNTKN